MRKLIGVLAFTVAMFATLVASNFLVGNGEHILAEPMGIVVIGGGWSLICAVLCAIFERQSWNILGHSVASGIIALVTFLVVGYLMFWSQGIDPVFKNGILTFAGAIASTLVMGGVGGAGFRLAAGRKPVKADSV